MAGEKPAFLIGGSGGWLVLQTQIARWRRRLSDLPIPWAASWIGWTTSVMNRRTISSQDSGIRSFCPGAGVCVGADRAHEGVGEHRKGDPADPGGVAAGAVLVEAGPFSLCKASSTRHLVPATFTGGQRDRLSAVAAEQQRIYHLVRFGLTVTAEQLVSRPAGRLVAAQSRHGAGLRSRELIATSRSTLSYWPATAGGGNAQSAGLGGVRRRLPCAGWRRGFGSGRGRVWSVLLSS